MNSSTPELFGLDVVVDSEAEAELVVVAGTGARVDEEGLYFSVIETPSIIKCFFSPYIIR